MTNVVDKELVKQALKELIIEDSDYFKKIIKELISEANNEDEELEFLIKKNFKRFDETFKALA
ncbi:MAG: hypothetical protein ACK4NY_02590 [Spirosomataceae bacterium]